LDVATAEKGDLLMSKAIRHRDPVTGGVPGSGGKLDWMSVRKESVKWKEDQLKKAQK
jgi:hypothetical protein